MVPYTDHLAPTMPSLTNWTLTPCKKWKSWCSLRILAGDFNVHHTEWLGRRTTDTPGRLMLQLANCLGLEQIDEPTRGDQILDLVLTDLPASSTTIANVDTSDHHPVLVKLNVHVFRDKPYRRKVWLYDQADNWEMRGYISSTDWSQVFLEKDPNKVCSRITEIISDPMDLHIPSKIITNKTGDKVWFNDKCRRASRKKRKIFRQLRKNKKWWQVINSLAGKAAHSSIPVIGHITAREKANIFCKTFAKKCNFPDADAPSPHLVDQPTIPSTDNIIFKPKIIKRLLNQLVPNKATGPDHIPARVLKECRAELASPLCRLFHLCFSHSVFPGQWNTATVIPIHKRESKADPSNYRPISLLCIISKVMESVVNKQLQNHRLQNNLLSSRQFGFRPGHSTGDLLIILAQNWNATLDKGEEACVIALDIKGAFDKVWHNGLHTKIRSKGVSGMLLRWLQSYLSERSMTVVLSGQNSEASSINASVPQGAQGSILGPLLFSVFIDDLVDECENELFLYADDSTLYAPIPSPKDSNKVAASLNRDLDRMKSWADRWKVTFEPTKCKSMIVCRKRTPSSINLYLGDYQLAARDELEILGVIFDSKLSWSKHVSSIASRAGQKLGALRKVANKLDIRGSATVYKAQVRSIMGYACLCWTSAPSTTLSQLDNIQRKALKIIGVNEATARTQLLIPSLTHRREVAAVTVFYKMYTRHCPIDLYKLLPPPLKRKRVT